jgi:hypothetical protein
MIMLFIKVLFWTFVFIIIGALLQISWYREWLRDRE